MIMVDHRITTDYYYKFLLLNCGVSMANGCCQSEIVMSGRLRHHGFWIFGSLIIVVINLSCIRISLVVMA